MMKTPLVIGAALMLAACSSSGQTAGQPSPAVTTTAVTPTTTPTQVIGAPPTPPPGARLLAGAGCGNAPVYQGAIPPWANENAPASLSYVIATPDLALGYLFSYPLRSGPDGNKILWYVRAPRGGQSLVAVGHPVGASQPIASFSKADDSSPGEIYPSGVTVPAAGCWRFHLAWNGYAADIDLLFH